MNNPESMETWLKVRPGTEFPLENIPFGIMKKKGGNFTVCTRIGDFAIDLTALYELNYFNHLQIPGSHAFMQPHLNAFIKLGKKKCSAVRKAIADIFSTGNESLKNNIKDQEQVISPIEKVELTMPLYIPNYTDFYSSLEHATNVGKLFRDPDNPLLPNWKHIPVAYHGRASSIVVSGTDIHRPWGQVKDDNQQFPELKPSDRMDIELELGFVIGKPTHLGEIIPVDKAEDHIFGFVLFNDLSARDIQKWEYVPLGPFLGKNFGSVISPWVVMLEALEPFRINGPEHDIPVLPYLECNGKNQFDIELTVYIQPEGSEEELICTSNSKYLYWNIKQQLAHHTINGCNIETGDVYASGTISGPEPGSFGSLLELTWNGSRPIHLKNGRELTWLQDNDTVIIRGVARNENLKIGLGEVRTKILPAKEAEGIKQK